MASLYIIQEKYEKYLLLPGILILCLISWIYFRNINENIYFCFGGDEAGYIVHAISMAEGVGWRKISLIPPTVIDHHPFLFSYILSIVVRIFGVNIIYMKALIILLYFIGLIFFMDLMRCRGDTINGVLSAILCATVPFSLSYSDRLLSELPYVCFSFATLWAFHRAFFYRKNKFYLLAGILLCLCAYYMRTIGLAIIISISASLFIKSKKTNYINSNGKSLPVFIAVFLFLGSIAWWVYCWSKYGAKGYWYWYLIEFMGVNEPGDIDLLFFISDYIKRFWFNFSFYENVLTHLFIPWMGYGFASVFLGFFFLFICIIGFISLARKYRSAHEVYILLFLFITLSWSFPEQRFLLPLYASIYLSFFNGIASLGNIFNVKLKILLPVFIALIVFLMNISISLTYKSSSINLPSIRVNDNYRIVPLDPDQFRILNLVSRSSYLIPSGSRITFPYADDFFLASGHKSLDWIMLSKKSDPLGAMLDAKVDYVFTSDSFPLYSKWVIGIKERAPERFEEIIRVENTNTALYKFDWE